MSGFKLVTLKCPSCGGSLSVGAATPTFACEYCGSTVAVERGGDGATLKLLSEGLARVERGTERVAAEHAIPRIAEELRTVRNERIAREQARQREAEYRAYELGEAKPRPIRELFRSFFIFVAAWIGGIFVMSMVHRFLHPDGGRPDAGWRLVLGPGMLVFGICTSVASALTRASRRRATRRRVQEQEEHAARRRQIDDAEFGEQIKELEQRLAAKRRIADA